MDTFKGHETAHGLSDVQTFENLLYGTVHTHFFALLTFDYRRLPLVGLSCIAQNITSHHILSPFLQTPPHTSPPLTTPPSSFPHHTNSLLFPSPQCPSTPARSNQM